MEIEKAEAKRLSGGRMTPCKGCGKEIVWGATAEGKKIPLDPRALVYTTIEMRGHKEIVRTYLAMVSHFATCPKANDFSGSK